MKEIKHFIWDFDGTLVDTYPNITSYLQKALRDFGYEVSQTDILEQMLVTIPHAKKYYAELYSIDYEELNARYSYHDKAGAGNVSYPFPNVIEVLKRIRELGGKNYVFTNRGATVYPMLERVGLIDEFDEIVSASDENFVSKPAPDSILRVFMAWQALDAPIEIEPQTLPTFERAGFTVVEWGGSEIK